MESEGAVEGPRDLSVDVYWMDSSAGRQGGGCAVIMAPPRLLGGGGMKSANQGSKCLGDLIISCRCWSRGRNQMPTGFVFG